MRLKQAPLIISSLALLVCFTFFSGLAQSQVATKVVILGTGTPVPDAERAGPGVAIIVNGETYLFDAGGGMVKRAVQAAQNLAIPELNPQNINYLFLTHLHSDHIHDVSELASSRWWGREQRLQIWGPEGLEAYTQNMNAMASIEADIRLVGTPEQLVIDDEGFKATATEIKDGIVFENSDISIEAFTVPHGEIRPAFGYRIVTWDKTIVISGDTTFSSTLVEKAKNADLLIHEVISGDKLAEQSEFWQLYHGNSHTTTSELARVANLAQPKQLLLYHILFYGASAEEIVAEVARDYQGDITLANDLDVF